MAEDAMVCGLCGADLKVAGSLAQIKGIWVCSHPMPRNEECFHRAVNRCAKTTKEHTDATARVETQAEKP